MDTQGERLKYARTAAGFTSATDAARRFGWNEETYKSHEKGARGLKPQIAAKYGRAYRVRPAWLLTGDGAAPLPTSVGVAEPTEPAPAGTAAISEVEANASAGGGGAIIEGDPERARWYVPETWVRHQLRARPTDIRMITVEGDSMEPDLHPGDIVMVDVNRQEPSPPGFFILDDGIGLLAKQLEHVPNTDPPKVTVTSRNTSYQAYDRSADDLRIIGRIVGLIRRL